MNQKAIGKVEVKGDKNAEDYPCYFSMNNKGVLVVGITAEGIKILGQNQAIELKTPIGPITILKITKKQVEEAEQKARDRKNASLDQAVIQSMNEADAILEAARRKRLEQAMEQDLKEAS